MPRHHYSDFEDYLDVLGFETGVLLRRGESLSPLLTETAQSTRSETSQFQEAPTTQALSTALSARSSAPVPRLPVLFVGEELTHTSASRELFLKMIQAMGLQSDQIKVLEAHKDSDRLKDEILSHNPQTVVIFGNTALPALFAQNSSVIDLRGRIHFFENIKVIATHHPALCLINPALKKPVWEDLQIVIQTLGLKS